MLLYVDDERLNRVVVRHMLEAAGLDMDEADDGPAGLAMLQAHDYRAVLMDLRMPGMDGLTAIREIRTWEGPKGEVPIIVVTADASPDLAEKCSAAGADGILVKPVGMKDLLKAVHSVLRGRANGDDAGGTAPDASKASQAPR